MLLGLTKVFLKDELDEKSRRRHIKMLCCKIKHDYDLIAYKSSLAIEKVIV